jgi:hypothetical protein
MIEGCYLVTVIGCNRKCACSLWVNCPKYIDEKNKEYRLHMKNYDFWEWYKNYFRVDFYPECTGNE